MNLNFKILSYLLITYTLITLGASAQNTIYLKFNKIGFDQGLSSYNIKKIIQDKQSFIWIATQEGLNRFDSRTIFNYHQGKGKFEISGTDIWDFQEDTALGLLWVAAYNSIDAISTTSGQVKVRLSVGTQDIWIKEILLEGSTIWIATNKGLMTTSTSGKEIRKITTDSSLMNQSISALEKDRAGRLWCYAPGYGFAVIDMKSEKLIGTITNKDLKLNRNPDFRLQNRVLLSPDGNILFGGADGFRSLSLDKTGIHCQAGFHTLQVADAITSFDFDGDNNLWFATQNTLCKYDVVSGKTYHIKDVIQNSMEQTPVQDIYFDKRRTMWIATQKGVLFTNGLPSPFKAYSQSENMERTIDHAYYVYPDTLNKIYVCTGNGFWEVNSDTRKIKTIDSSGTYFYCFRGPENTLIVSRKDRVMYLANDNQLKGIEQKFGELATLRADALNSSIYTGDSLIYMGSESFGGVYKWHIATQKLEKKDSHSSHNKLKSDIINTIYPVANSALILSDYQIMQWNTLTDSVQEIVLHDPDDPASPLTFYFDIIKIKNFFYTAVYGKGVYKLDKNFKIVEKLSEQQGLCNNGVYKLFSVGDSLLVITTNKGLSVYDLNKRKFQNYYQSDGLHSNAFEEGCGFQKDNLIYAGGVRGFTIIDPSKFIANSVPPRVYINRVLIDRSKESTDIDTANLDLGKLEVPNDVLRTTLYLSGINYGNPERTTFAYRIKETNKDWVNIGTQNYISLIGLAPGVYHVEVKAANESNVWSTPATITLIYLPKWYQTILFKVFLLLSFIGACYAAYKLRINYIFKQQQIRKDVAADLHDDIGSSLHSVKMFAHLAATEPTKTEYLKNMQENLERATTGLRDMIWILDDNYDSIYDMRQRLAQFATAQAEAIGISVQIDIAEELHGVNLSKPAKRNLFLIIKEAVNNCVKYAGCKNVQITFGMHSKKMVITIKDNGKGFDIADASSGYGLKNIQSRAAQINFDYDIKSGSDGTEIKLTSK